MSRYDHVRVRIRIAVKSKVRKAKLANFREASASATRIRRIKGTIRLPIRDESLGILINVSRDHLQFLRTREIRGVT
jgi:hypothetical protein